MNLLKYLFIPHKNNNYRAKILHIDFMAIMLFILVVLNFTLIKLQNTNVIYAFKNQITVEQLLYYTNKARQENNLPPLKLNDQLSQAAQLKADDMFQKNYWSHYAPDGKSPWDFILKTGYQYEYAGENLARSFYFAKDVVSAWMNSESHRANILKKEYTEVGFAVKEGVLQGEPTTLVVQMFAKPILATNQQDYQPNQAIPQEQTTNQKVLSVENKPAINLKFITFETTLIYLIMLSVVLVIDYIAAVKTNLIRNTSHNMISFIFSLTILIGIIMAVKGKIL
ncbi:MAG: hypothetical protein KatS3mg090_0178 [Patescibacteria group bacterium]|nr:MAG: hypothetical protein KatS3mg090_0178 [Patescibacteria group bacterium]